MACSAFACLSAQRGLYQPRPRVIAWLDAGLSVKDHKGQLHQRAGRLSRSESCFDRSPTVIASEPAAATRRITGGEGVTAKSIQIRGPEGDCPRQLLSLCRYTYLAQTPAAGWHIIQFVSVIPLRPILWNGG